MTSLRIASTSSLAPSRSTMNKVIQTEFKRIERGTIKKRELRRSSKPFPPQVGKKAFHKPISIWKREHALFSLSMRSTTYIHIKYLRISSNERRLIRIWEWNCVRAANRSDDRLFSLKTKAICCKYTCTKSSFTHLIKKRRLFPASNIISRK